jgi:hypothetical protein
MITENACIYEWTGTHVSSSIPILYSQEPILTHPTTVADASLLFPYVLNVGHYRSKLFGYLRLLTVIQVRSVTNTSGGGFPSHKQMLLFHSQLVSAQTGHHQVVRGKYATDDVIL